MQKKSTLQLLIISIFFFCATSHGQTYYKLVDQGIDNSTNVEWNDENLIITDNDWSNIPYLRGFRGDGLTTTLDVDPRTITADGTGTPVVIYANQSDPNTFNQDGFAEFRTPTDSLIAFRASNTANAPFLMIYLNTQNVPDDCFPTLYFNLLDIDSTINNSTQQVAVQYRIGETGDFTNLGSNFFHQLPNFDFVGGYQPDASRGPYLKGHRTFNETGLPFDCRDQPKVQLRIITTNASGGNEWIGIDNISLGMACLLPVSYSNFSAEVKDKMVNIKWKASSISPLDRFEIERSEDGIKYHKIATIFSKGSGDFDYSFLDVNPLEGTGFYRIKILNGNNGFDYTNIVKVNRQQKNLKIIISSSADKINVQLNSKGSYNSVLQVVNSTGVIVRHQPILVAIGNNNFQVKTNGLPKGNYFIRLKAKEGLLTERFVK